ncbi:GrpB family protein [Peribacillus frigoritolerans]|uniref:GrpB family protein n=1 Tax=Peribacillus castrilensis TaxID=2897690 RepID=UPI00296F696D
MEKTVKIEEYNPDWVSEFQQEKARILEVLKNDSLCVEHIGSTSVMGLGAKPILDIMAGVQHLAEVDMFIEPLKSIGYEFVPHKEFPERRFPKGVSLEKANGERGHTICISIDSEVNSGRINFHSGTI